MMRYVLLFSLSMSLLACSTKDENPLEVTLTALPDPAGIGSALPFLHTNAAETTTLSWVVTEDTLATLMYAEWTGSGEWGTPRQVAQGTDWFVNWADYPSVSSKDSVVVAHWLAKSAVATTPYDYDVNMAVSKDGGATWDEPFVLHTDGVPAEHGFVSTLARNDGRFFATWLDGRHTKNDEGEHVGAMSLRGLSFDPTNPTLGGVELDGRVCDCCQTAAALTSAGPIVAYRDRSEGEIRDIAVVRAQGNGWTEPIVPYADGWEIAGCPVNGPALDAQEGLVALAWFTGAQNVPQVKLAFSTDAGATWGEAIVVAKETPMGRVDVRLTPNGNAAITWMEAEGEIGHIRWALYSPKGKQLAQLTVGQTSSARKSGFPVMENTSQGMLVAWTEISGDDTQVKAARVRW